MNDDITTAVKVLAVHSAAPALLIWLGVVMMKAARRGGGGMRGIGAVALMMFGWAKHARSAQLTPWPKRRTAASARARTPAIRSIAIRPEP